MTLFLKDLCIVVLMIISCVRMRDEYHMESKCLKFENTWSTPCDHDITVMYETKIRSLVVKEVVECHTERGKFVTISCILCAEDDMEITLVNRWWRIREKREEWFKDSAWPLWTTVYEESCFCFCGYWLCCYSLEGFRKERPKSKHFIGWEKFFCCFEGTKYSSRKSCYNTVCETRNRVWLMEIHWHT